MISIRRDINTINMISSNRTSRVIYTSQLQQERQWWLSNNLVTTIARELAMMTMMMKMILGWCKVLKKMNWMITWRASSAGRKMNSFRDRLILWISYLSHQKRNINRIMNWISFSITIQSNNNNSSSWIVIIWYKDIFIIIVIIHSHCNSIQMKRQNLNNSITPLQ